MNAVHAVHAGQQVNPDSLRVMIVDDHVLMGETMVSSLSATSDFDVISVLNVQAAVQEIERNGRFNVILLDYEIPGVDPMVALDRLIDANEGGVALFSGVAKRMTIDRALDRGAVGFVPKTLAFKSLRHALRLMADGEVFLPSELMRRESQSHADGPDLKSVEARVLALLADGQTNKQIARELDLDETTVKMHMRKLFNKFGVTNRTQVVLAAQKLGIC